MQTKSDDFYIKTAWLLIIASTLFRMAYSNLFLLAPDETNYWQWSRHLAWGYHDQAPLLAWAIRLSTLAFGHTEFAVRLPSIISVAVATGYLTVMAHRWVSPRAAFMTAFLSQGIFLLNVGGLLATPDGLQAAGWAGAAYHVARAYEEDTWPQWLLGGLWFGLGLLSKYTMVVFLPGAYLYGLLSPYHRNRLARPRPYTGLLLGLLMFVPVVLWNMENGWNSMRHVAHLGGADKSFGLHFKYFGDLMGSQAALLSPLVFILILAAWHLVAWKHYDPRKWIYPYLFFTSFPLFALFLVLSFHTRIYGNWPGAAYLTAFVLMVAFFDTPDAGACTARSRRLGRKLWPWTWGSAYFFSVIVLLQVVYPILPIPMKLDRTAYELAGWDHLGETVDNLRREMPRPDNTFLFGMRYQIASELAFYAPENPETVSINKWTRPNVYDYWWREADLIGRDAVGVSYGNRDFLDRLREVFDHVDPPIKLPITGSRPFSRNKQELIKTYTLYRAYGFKGGLHWVPRDPSDIRAGKAVQSKPDRAGVGD